MMRSKIRWTFAGILALVVGGVAWATSAPGITITIPVEHAGVSRLVLPAAPSHCRVRHFRIVGPLEGGTFYYLSWRDNSTDEDGFTVERWWRNGSGDWVLHSSFGFAAGTTSFGLGANPGNDVRFRVKATSASGDSAWSNWSH